MTLKPAHKAVKQYYDALAAYSDHDVGHETALRSAFQNLLADTARGHGWLLVPEQPTKVRGSAIRPDGTLRDQFNLHRGYWEAKDSGDHLDEEIRKKIAAGYPLSNIIFEDTRRAVLFQNGGEALRVDLRQPAELCDLLNQFFAFVEPDIESFGRAIEEFRERVPELALALAGKIAEAHRENARFQNAFDGFFSLCQTALNPNISQAAVDEMLVQHLLTERLIRTIFDNPEFTSGNVIAAEVEKVIAALVSKSFNRAEFLKSLDRFYRAIEEAARSLEDFAEKQHFLNTVYERFFQGYSVKTADTHGIVYTPQQIVDFMCASVAEVLEGEFGLSLGSPGVTILDPCTGTGNFIVNLLRRIPKKHLPRMYREQLFANEVMLLPYYIASLNIEHAYYELTGEREPFEGLCFVDTLDLAEPKQSRFSFMTEQNTARVARQKGAPITVIVGNPPYNVGQMRYDDRNANRAYAVVDKRVKETYARDSAATSVSKLNDAYVKFFRWAADRLEGREGIVCFVSNNSFVEQIAFDGMRKHLLQDFTHIYHMHLEGNVRQNPKLTGTAYNVFGIQVGVGITLAVRARKHRARRVFFHRVDKALRRQAKLDWLAKRGSQGRVKWTKLVPDERGTWLVPKNGGEYASLLPLSSGKAVDPEAAAVEAIFCDYSLGVATHRDMVVYDFDKKALTHRADEFSEAYNGDVDAWRRAEARGKPAPRLGEHVVWDEDLKRNLLRHRYAEFSESRIRAALYRPFGRRNLYFDRLLNARVYGFPRFFPTEREESENRVIAVSQIGYRAQQFSALISDRICDLHLCAAIDGHQCFPFYVYNEDGTNRRENVTDWALERFRTEYSDKKLDKWDVFYYVYGLLHHPGYREKFADNLRRDLPRIPLAGGGDKQVFRAFSTAGRELARLHLDYEQLEPHPLTEEIAASVPLSYRVDDKLRLSKDRTALAVNRSLTLRGIPAAAFDYRLGNRSALEWVIDQYQVKQDARSGIRSDPNRVDDPEYIIRLVGQVIRVSLETMRVVRALPAQFS